MDYYNRYTLILPIAFLLMIFLCSVLLIMPVSAADSEMEAYLGDTIPIHGVSYVSDRVYLFLTGPGLPANGVTLTDISQRADQGHFTIVVVESDQSWSLRWDTSRLSTSIDPGTYIVYVTTEPVDKANLGGSSTYQTLQVWLKDPQTSKASASAGASYTLRPRAHPSSSKEVPTLVFTSATPAPTPLPTTLVITDTMAPQTTTTTAPTKTALLPITTLFAVLVCTAINLAIMNNRTRKEE